VIPATRRLRERAARATGAPAVAGAALVVAAAVGASVGALVRPAPVDSYLAEAVISIRPDVPPAADELARQRARWIRAAEALRAPQVLLGAAAGSGLPLRRAKPRLNAGGSPDAGLFIVRARAVNSTVATAMAGSAAASTLEFLRASSGNPGFGSPRTRFDFENGAQGWGVGRSIFLLPPTSTGAARGRGRRGRGLLRTTCHYTQPGCGTWVTIAKALSPGHPYLAQAWVRAPRGRAALRLAFGAAPEDVADGRTVLVSRRWTRITVRWVPQLQVGSAEIDVQVNAAGAVTFDADQVSVTSPGGKLVQIPRLDIPDRYRLAARAQAAGQLHSKTVTAALVGGAIGLLAAAAGLAAGALARRRHHAEQ